MTALFYIASGLAVIAALLAVTRRNALHALLYLVVTLFALALDFLVLGAPFLAALEVIVYAGAIMVVILFAIMMLAPGTSQRQEARWLAPRAWVLPALLAAALALLTVGALATGTAEPLSPAVIGPRQVGAVLFTTYLVGVELASILLLTGLVGAYYLGARE